MFRIKKAAKEEYSEKLAKAKTDKQKQKLEEQFQTIINNAEQKLERTKASIFKRLDDTVSETKNDNGVMYQSDKNNVLDWTDKFNKVPTFAEIEKHIKDIIASGQVFDTLSPDWKIDIKGGNRVVDKITNQGNFQKLQNSAKKRHNKYTKGIEELINHAIYDHSDNNKKPKEKPNVLQYHYFNVNVKIGDKTYLVSLECEETKNANQGNYAKRSSKSHQGNVSLNQTNNNVKIVHLYNIVEVKGQYFQSTEFAGSSIVDIFDNKKAVSANAYEVNDSSAPDTAFNSLTYTQMLFKFNLRNFIIVLSFLCIQLNIFLSILFLRGLCNV